MYLKSSIPINAVQIWMYTAFSEVPTKLVTFRRCFRCLKKVSISHLSLYKAATVDAFQVKLFVKNSYSALFMLSQKRTNRIFLELQLKSGDNFKLPFFDFDLSIFPFD